MTLNVKLIDDVFILHQQQTVATANWHSKWEQIRKGFLVKYDEIYSYKQGHGNLFILAMWKLKNLGAKPRFNEIKVTKTLNPYLCEAWYLM